MGRLIYMVTPSIYTSGVTKRLIDIDDEALSAARAALGTATMRDTVNEALRRAGRTDAARFEAAVIALGAVDFADRADAWRRS